MAPSNTKHSVNLWGFCGDSVLPPEALLPWLEGLCSPRPQFPLQGAKPSPFNTHPHPISAVPEPSLCSRDRKMGHDRVRTILWSSTKIPVCFSGYLFVWPFPEFSQKIPSKNFYLSWCGIHRNKLFFMSFLFMPFQIKQAALSLRLLPSCAPIPYLPFLFSHSTHRHKATICTQKCCHIEGTAFTFRKLSENFQKTKTIFLHIHIF